MKRPHGVLIIGEYNVDIILTGDVTPEFGQVEKIIDDIALLAGGSCGIFAAGCSRQGLNPLFASIVGDDLYGRFLLQRLEDVGGSIEHIIVDPAIKTGVTVMLSRGQDRAGLTYLGSMAEIGPEIIDEAWFDQCQHLHVASPFLLTRLRPALPELMHKARAHGMTVSLDTNWDPDEAWQVDDLIAETDILLPNENELLAISGEKDLDTAIAAMSRRVSVLVVKRGAKGATGVAAGRTVQVPACPAKVVDTTGAGDTFDAGFISGWLRELPLEQCLRLGTICGGATTEQLGGFNGQPTWEQARSRL